MPTITSSNRSPAQWDAYLERSRPAPSTERLMRENPRTSALVASHAIPSAPRVPSGPFAHVVGVDACGAPITGDALHVPCENLP